MDATFQELQTLELEQRLLTWQLALSCGAQHTDKEEHYVSSKE